MKLPLLALLAFVTAAPAVADVYKCRLPDGRIEIANTPCARSAGTLDQRPEENVSADRKADAERDLERQRAFIEKREAARREEDKLEQERQLRREEAAAREAARTPAPAAPPPSTTFVPVPVPVSPVDQCIQNVYRLHLGAGETSRRIQQCQGGGGGGVTITINPPPTPGSYTPCPKNDRHCRTPAR